MTSPSWWGPVLGGNQRTPCSVGVRDQRPTDLTTWKDKIAPKRGWQQDRNANFASFLDGTGEGENLINDGWTKTQSYKAIIGGPHEKPLAPEDLPAHIGALVAIDYEYMYSETVRQRVDAIIEDKATTEALKPWYPIWCKRPTFHDDYLACFNKPNVHLVDTQGKGVSGSTPTGLLVGDKEYPIDILILSTGYRSPAQGMCEPSSHSGMTFTGRDGLDLAQKWNTQGATTLHGMLTHGFPNMFITGPAQTGATANFAYVQDVMSQHVAYIVDAAIKRGRENAVVEATEAGEQGWTGEIMKWSLWISGVAICTQGYINNEGAMSEDPMEPMKLLRGAPYTPGMNAYTKVLRKCREEGSMDGVTVS